jgi:hypothetical protein
MGDDDFPAKTDWGKSQNGPRCSLSRVFFVDLQSHGLILQSEKSLKSDLSELADMKRLGFWRDGSRSSFLPGIRTPTPFAWRMLERKRYVSLTRLLLTRFEVVDDEIRQDGLFLPSAGLEQSLRSVSGLFANSSERFKENSPSFGAFEDFCRALSRESPFEFLFVFGC